MSTAHTPLQVDFIITDEQPQDKQEALQVLAEHAAKTKVLSKHKVKDLFKRLEQREVLGSTGFGEGVAIPHCSIDKLDDFVLGVMVTSQGVDFASIDGTPVQVFFLIIGPTEQRNRHIKILSAISKMVKTQGAVHNLLSKQAPEEIEELLKEHLTIREEKPDTEGYCLINTYIQKEEVFDEILELLSAEVEGSITVIETQNAGEYLNRLPLFSSYWTEGSSTFNRLIQAIVPKGRCNNLIRQINLIEDTYADDPGILIIAQELMYASGTIDF
jgi:mannitol/fructose-specific phosphotransferase system IIA component (Ntr-type)